MDNTDFDRLAAWLTRQSPKRLGYLNRLRWAGMPEKHLGPIAWALYRRQYGLEARALVSLVMAPPEVLAEARGGLQLRQLLTPAYAALASLLLDPETPTRARQRARTDLAARTYLPSATDCEEWTAEARACLCELRARRSRWDVRATEQVKDRQLRGAERRRAGAGE